MWGEPVGNTRCEGRFTITSYVTDPSVSPNTAGRHLRAAESALVAGEQRLWEILEAAPVAFASTDAEGLILDWNAEAELLFGWSRADALGRNFASTVLPPALHGAYQRELSELLEVRDGDRASRVAELTALRKDDGDCPVELTISRVPADGSHLFRIYARDISAQRQADADRRFAEEQLMYQSLHDPLTGLPNRAFLLDRIGHALSVARRDSSTIAVLYCDVDNFKLVNDSLGHQAGDELLVQVSRRIQDALRHGDSLVRPRDDTVARIGADEFVVLCESLSAERDAAGIAERVIATAIPPFDLAGERLFVRLSVGVATPSAGATGASLIRDADTALHRAKERGGARYEVFDADIRTRVVNRIRRENDLREALESDQLCLYYQPIVAVPDGAIVGAEALMRWEHPQHGLLPPSEFITLAEASGLIVPMGRWAIQEACAQLTEWQSSLGAGSPFHVSVNVSARQVAEDDLTTLITETLQRYPINPSQLILEVTESILLSDTNASIATLGQLNDLGVRLALDDFGTGYSSLSYLRFFPFNVLKLDRSFISGLGHVPADMQIAAAVIEMARALAMTVIAEGVETPDQLEWIRRLGSHLAQGYHFAPPMPAREFSDLLEPVGLQLPGRAVGA